MLNGFKIIKTLASSQELIIPGHDPLITKYFPRYNQFDFVWRLDKGPIKKINF